MQAEVEVTWDDQVQINEFGRLSQKLMQLESELDSKKVGFEFSDPNIVVLNVTDDVLRSV